MNDSYTIIRRFTPPTCTLEIWGKNSPLSRWAKKTIVKDVRFKLSFDDPRILEGEPITLSGDRDKLEQLYDLILGYTENFLEQSFTPQLSTLALVNQERSPDTFDPHQPYIQPQGLVNHQLHLGNLMAEESSSISLSATQLFDLVSALEEYKTEMAVLAQLEAQQKQKTLPLLPLGIGIAGILLAVGLGIVGIKEVAKKSATEEPVASTQESPSPTIADAPIETPTEDVIPPEVPQNAEKPAITTQKNDPLASLEKLPPPPAVETLKPQPDIPDPAKYPPSGNLTLPPIASLPKLQEPISETESTQKPQSNNSENSSQVESTINIPPDMAKPTSKTNSAEETTKTESSTKTDRETEITVNNNQTAIAKKNEELAASGVLSQRELAEQNSNSSASQTLSEQGTDDRIPRSNNISNSNNLARNDLTSKSTLEESAPEASMSRENVAESKIPQAKQLQEVASYFQQKWRSPSELKQTLEYRLVIDRDGSLQRVIPIGKASEIYLDRTNIPLMGEPFVSALSQKQKQNLTVRLLLSPDGEVRTFLE